MSLTNTSVKAGDILIDSSTRTTLKVVRVLGNSRVEVTNIGVAYAISQIMDLDRIQRGIASGNIKRI